MPCEEAIRDAGEETPSRYKEAGVDIDAGNAVVEAIKPLAAATGRPGSEGGLGGFGAVFDPQAAGFADPVLVAATDGVGTKLKLALEAGTHDTVGIDLVAMCANDLVVQGAEPLFFLDYYASGALVPETARAVVAGIAEGCRRAGCALIGGETAEMPGMYAGGDYDLAGFCVGAAERGTLLNGADVAPGDLVLGLASDGIHANGYSLVRKVLAAAELTPDSAAPFDTAIPLRDILLSPTRIYVKSCLAAVRAGRVKALAHVTGGGLPENLPRVLPDGLVAHLDAGAWSLPPVFRWLAETARMPAEDLLRTFNCGIGMVAVCAPEDAPEAMRLLAGNGETVFPIGRIETADEAGSLCIVENTEAAWGV